MTHNEADSKMLEAIATLNLGVSVVKYRPELTRPACYVQSPRGRYGPADLIKIAADGGEVAAIPGEQFVFCFLSEGDFGQIDLELLRGSPTFKKNDLPVHVFKARSKMTPCIEWSLKVGECAVVVPPSAGCEWVTPPNTSVPVLPDAIVERFVVQAVSLLPTDGIFESEPNAILYGQLLRDNIFRLRAEDSSYVLWHRLLCVCHRLKTDGRALFLEWFERTGGAKWNEGIRSHITYLFDDLDKLESVEAREREGSKVLGMEWFLRHLCEQDAPVVDEIVMNDQALLDELTEEELKARADAAFAERWPLLPLTGCLERFRKEIERSMPWQNEALYAVPVMCLQFALQRKIVYRPDGMQSHWWCLVGGPASNKSEMKRIIKEVLNPIDPMVAIDAVESVNGLKAQLVSYPTRVLLLDEGLKLFNSMLNAEGKSPLDAKTLGLILNLHNNKTNIEATGNRIKNHRLPKIILPQMSLVTFDQNAYWSAFRTGSAIDNGLLSRFFVVKLNQMPKLSLEKDNGRVSSLEIKRFSDAIGRLIPHQAAQVRTGDDGEIDYHSWSPINLNDPSPFEYAEGTMQIFHEFNDSLIEWSEADEDTRTPVLHRVSEAVRMIAQLIALADGTNVVTPHHARIAAGLAFRTVIANGEECTTTEVKVLLAAGALIKKNGAMSLSAIMRKLPHRLRSGEGSWERNAKVIARFFKVDGIKYELPD